jgi:hypothetical protein
MKTLFFSCLALVSLVYIGAHCAENWTEEKVDDMEMAPNGTLTKGEFDASLLTH